MDISYDFFRLIRKPIRALYKNKAEDTYKSQLYEKYVNLFDQDANDYIREQLMTDKPLMVSKFGGFELTELCTWQSLHIKRPNIHDVWRFLKGERETLWWDFGIDGLCSNAGFFPNDDSLRPRYYHINVQAMKNIDVLGSYLAEEYQFKEELKDAVKVNLNGYYAPFLYKNPWTSALKGKKVLVVHPFDKEIQMQYSKRKLLWKDENVLPEFDELITYKSIQSMLGADVKYKNWFDALEKMEDDISKIDFDVAIVGCGAYGMPLSSYIKTLKKQVIHLAGWTQVLFGIKGGRWENLDFVSSFFNDSWIRPYKNSTPLNAEQIEKGCYW